MTSLQGEVAAPTRNQNLFLWKGPSVQINGKAHYQAFELNGVSFAIGDCVYLFPEDEHSSHYIGRLVSAYSDEESPDPLCIEVKWYERRTNFEPNTRGIEESEREVFELEDTDINQIGCISGKVQVVRSRSYEEAYAQLQGADYDWYFCRGYFMQASNSFQYYTNEELGLFGNPLRQLSPAPALEPKQEVNDTWDEDGTPTPDPINHKSGVGRQKKGGRVCLECGATQTPQWREGPAGPRTLCNACGLRIVRAAARLKREGSSGSGGGGGRGRGGSRSAPGSSKKGQKSRASAAELTPHEDAAAALLSWPLANGVDDDEDSQTRTSRQGSKRKGFFPDEQHEGGRGKKRGHSGVSGVSQAASMGLELNEDMVRKCNELMMGLAAGGMFGAAGAGAGDIGALNLQALSGFPFQAGQTGEGGGATAPFAGLPGFPNFPAGDLAAAAAAAAASLGSIGGMDASSSSQQGVLQGSGAIPALPGGFEALLSSGGAIQQQQQQQSQSTAVAESGAGTEPSEEDMAAAAAAAAAAAIQSMNGFGEQPQPSQQQQQQEQQAEDHHIKKEQGEGMQQQEPNQVAEQQPQEPLPCQEQHEQPHKPTDEAQAQITALEGAHQVEQQESKQAPPGQEQQQLWQQHGMEQEQQQNGSQHQEAQAQQPQEKHQQDKLQEQQQQPRPAEKEHDDEQQQQQLQQPLPPWPSEEEDQQPQRAAKEDEHDEQQAKRQRTDAGGVEDSGQQQAQAV